jgi:hypothetical protein
MILEPPGTFNIDPRHNLRQSSTPKLDEAVAEYVKTKFEPRFESELVLKHYTEDMEAALKQSGIPGSKSEDRKLHDFSHSASTLRLPDALTEVIFLALVLLGIDFLRTSQLLCFLFPEFQRYWTRSVFKVTNILPARSLLHHSQRAQSWSIKVEMTEPVMLVPSYIMPME